MKKMTLALVALAAIIFCACKSEEKPTGPVQELKQTVEQILEKMEKANTMEEVEAVSDELEKAMEEMDKKYPDFEPTPEEEKELQEILEKGQKTAQEAAGRFIKDAIDRAGALEQ